MLRDLKNSYLLPRILPFDAVTASSVLTLALGDGDYDTSVSGSSGVASLTFKTPLQRVPLVFGSPGTGAGTGAFFSSANHLATSLDLETRASAGTLTDGASYGVILGYDSTYADFLSRSARIVKCTARKPRLLSFTVDGTGTAAITVGAGLATLTDNGTGNYTLTFNRPFGMAGAAFGVCHHASVNESSLRVESFSATSINIRTFSGTPAAADRIFSLHVMGFDATNAVIDARQSIKVPALKPVMIAGRVTYSGGVPSVTVNSGTITSVTDGGTGDVTLTFSEPFARVPVPMATGIESNRVITRSVSATAVNFITTTAAGTLSDKDFDFLLTGSNDSIEYGEVS